MINRLLHRRDSNKNSFFDLPSFRYCKANFRKRYLNTLGWKVLQKTTQKEVTSLQKAAWKLLSYQYSKPQLTDRQEEAA